MRCAASARSSWPIATGRWRTFRRPIASAANLEAFLNAVNTLNPPNFKLVWGQNGSIQNYMPGDSLLIELSIAQMLTAYVTGQIAARDVPRAALSDPVERALRFIHEQLEDEPGYPLTLDELSEAAAVTPEQGAGFVWPGARGESQQLGKDAGSEFELHARIVVHRSSAATPPEQT